MTFARLAARKTTKQTNKYLLLGTANNPPTKLGMMRFLKNLLDENIDIDLIVAGYGTECFKGFENKKIEVLDRLGGSLTSC